MVSGRETRADPLAAGPSQAELVVLDWFKRWISYPRDAEGILVGGVSAANLTALACAREVLVGAGSGDGVIYVSNQTRSSVLRAARLLGFRPDQVRSLPTDRHYRLSLEALTEAVAEDDRAFRKPLIVVANAGSTSTGSIDPLSALADFCWQQGLWLHVDATHGGFAAVTERGRRLLVGLDRADSVTLDAHGWLDQPIECGCVLVREPRLLERASLVAPEYVHDVVREEVDHCGRGLQLTRDSRAIRAWLSLQCFGTAAFVEAVDRILDLAQLAERAIREHPDLELLCPATLGVVCFRRHVPGVTDERELERVNAELVSRLESTGRALVSGARLDGRYALRMCVVDHATSAAAVTDTVLGLGHAPLHRLARNSALAAPTGP